jgi:hypothetical protein
MAKVSVPDKPLLLFHEIAPWLPAEPPRGKRKQYERLPRELFAKIGHRTYVRRAVFMRWAGIDASAN